MQITNNEKSRAYFQQAKQVIPGGVNSPVRAFKAVGGEPRFIRSAKGAYLIDVDGNALIDYVGSWGPMILGHADSDVIKTLENTAKNGLSFRESAWIKQAKRAWARKWPLRLWAGF